MASSRKKIEKFCKEKNILIELLEYERKGQHIYGDYSDESEWCCKYFIATADNEYHYESWAYTAEELIEKIEDDRIHSI